MLKLLLADDERIIREGVEAMIPFDRLGLTLTASCANAFDALDSMADDMPDVLITDVKMPRMDGLALIERALKLNPALECVVLSGFDEFDFARRAIKMGVREYLLKPCSRQELVESLERITADVRARRQRSSDALADRQARIEDLAGRLSLLAAEAGEHPVQMEQVQALARATGEELLLREAFTSLVARHEIQAARGFAAIQRLYGEENWAAVIAQGLSGAQFHSGQRRSFVNAMCEYIRTHYQDEELSLQFLADHVIHMRADYIGQEFARDTGRKLSAYLKEVRMEKAKALLASCTEEPRIYEIAEAVGLGHNPQYFSTLFRKYTGMNPSEYVCNLTKNTKN